MLNNIGEPPQAQTPPLSKSVETKSPDDNVVKTAENAFKKGIVPARHRALSGNKITPIKIGGQPSEAALKEAKERHVSSRNEAVQGSPQSQEKASVEGRVEFPKITSSRLPKPPEGWGNFGEEKMLEFRNALLSGDADKVQEMIHTDPEIVNGCQEMYLRPLELAFIGGNNEVKQHLLNTPELNLLIIDDNGHTMIHRAALIDDHEIVDALKDKGLNDALGVEGGFGHTPSQIARHFGYERLEEKLKAPLSNRGDPQENDEVGGDVLNEKFVAEGFSLADQLEAMGSGMLKNAGVPFPDDDDQITYVSLPDPDLSDAEDKSSVENLPPEEKFRALVNESRRDGKANDTELVIDAASKFAEWSGGEMQKLEDQIENLEKGLSDASAIKKQRENIQRFAEQVSKLVDAGIKKNERKLSKESVRPTGLKYLSKKVNDFFKRVVNRKPDKPIEESSDKVGRLAEVKKKLSKLAEPAVSSDHKISIEEESNEIEKMAKTGQVREGRLMRAFDAQLEEYAKDVDISDEEKGVIGETFKEAVADLSQRVEEGEIEPLEAAGRVIDQWHNKIQEATTPVDLTVWEAVSSKFGNIEGTMKQVFEELFKKRSKSNG